MTAIEKEMVKAAHADVVSALVLLLVAQENGRRLKAAQFDDVVRNVTNARKWLDSLKRDI